MQKECRIKPAKPDQFALTFFLSLSLHNVLLLIEEMSATEKEWALEQVCDSACMLFPKPFEA